MMTSFLLNKSFFKKILQFILGALFLFLLFPKGYPQPHEKEPLLIYANQCDDEIRLCFIKALNNAKKSILLHIYSLNDKEICAILERKYAEEVKIKIILDSKNKKSFKNLESCIHYKEKSSGLMHQKILVIDESQIWIGSANFTSSSLRTHDNLVVALFSKEMANSIINEKGGTFFIGNQKIELFLLPEEKKIAFTHLLSLLGDAEKSLIVAMFTWTHPLLTEKIIQMNEKISVMAVLDQTSAEGTSKRTQEILYDHKVPFKLNKCSPLLHHKFVYIDKKILILGSANWTKAAFSKNDECLLIIHDLTTSQQKKIDRLCHAIKATSRFPECQPKKE